MCVTPHHSGECLCKTPYTGLRCGTKQDFCDSNPCQNNATCTSLHSHYMCHCPSGFMSLNCEIEVNECNSNPCRFVCSTLSSTTRRKCCFYKAFPILDTCFRMVHETFRVCCFLKLLKTFANDRGAKLSETHFF